MAFFEQRFPVEYGFGARGGPVFSTEVNKTTGGQRYANRNWQYPIHRYDISAGIKVESDFEVYRAFFYNVAGQFDGFRFKDWHDYSVPAAGGPGNSGTPMVVVSSGVTYQMQRLYKAGTRIYARPIVKPVQGTILVYRTRGSAVTLAAATVDYTTGLVTIVSGHVAGDTYSWSGEFDVPVAFTSDAMEAVIVDKNNGRGLIISWPTVQIEELRNP